MARNLYFSEAVQSEQKLYEDIIIESLKMYGQDVYYLPRVIMNEDTVLGHDISSKFDFGYRIEMYIENADGFEGEGDLFTKFGVEIRDEATFVVSKRRWGSTVNNYSQTISTEDPRTGDLIYLPLSKSLFEIQHVEHEQPFYQLSNLPIYKMRATLFDYAGEDLDTGITEIDQIEKDDTYQQLLTYTITSGTFELGENITQTLSDGTIISGEILNVTPTQLTIAHIGASDGKLHFFTPSATIPIYGISSLAEAQITLAAEVNNIAKNEQNTSFDLNFIDFTENNPFGDPE
mgnify:FL=1|tara:strand:- start:2838 stop:3707 length:870 start_codon:yes stop_codon:yes gene_type:complete